MEDLYQAAVPTIRPRDMGYLKHIDLSAADGQYRSLGASALRVDIMLHNRSVMRMARAL